MKKRSAWALFFAVFLFAVANIKVYTRYGIDYTVYNKTIPLYVKVAGFIARHFEYSELTKEIIRGRKGEDERVDAIFDWTVENIKGVPAGFHVMDDHIANIIIRRYGAADQMADVFTMLCVYAGIPAFFEKVEGNEGRWRYLSFAKINGAWQVFDVERRVSWRTIEDAAHNYKVNEVRFPRVLRAEEQMPFKRLRRLLRGK